MSLWVQYEARVATRVFDATEKDRAPENAAAAAEAAAAAPGWLTVYRCSCSKCLPLACCLLLAAGCWLLAAADCSCCCCCRCCRCCRYLLPLKPWTSWVAWLPCSHRMASMWDWFKEERVQRLVLAAIESLDDPIRCWADVFLMHTCLVSVIVEHSRRSLTVDLPQAVQTYLRLWSHRRVSARPCSRDVMTERGYCFDIVLCCLFCCFCLFCSLWLCCLFCCFAVFLFSCFVLLLFYLFGLVCFCCLCCCFDMLLFCMFSLLALFCFFVCFLCFLCWVCFDCVLVLLFRCFVVLFVLFVLFVFCVVWTFTFCVVLLLWCFLCWSSWCCCFYVWFFCCFAYAGCFLAFVFLFGSFFLLWSLGCFALWTRFHCFRRFLRVSLEAFLPFVRSLCSPFLSVFLLSCFLLLFQGCFWHDA